MMNKLPPIYEDELIYSLLGRYLVYNGIWRDINISNELFSASTYGCGRKFMGNINHNVVSDIIKKGMNIEKLIYRHTMFYAYIGYTSNKYSSKLFHWIINQPLKAEQRIDHKNKFDMDDQFLKYCPLCIKRDREKYQEAYWHCIHQIRGLQICPVHKCKLIESSVEYYKTKAQDKIVPLELIAQMDKVIFEKNKINIELSKYISDRFLKQDIEAKKINHCYFEANKFEITHTIYNFYNSNNIKIPKEKIWDTIIDSSRSFYIMSAIYYYLESHT